MTPEQLKSAQAVIKRKRTNAAKKYPLFAAAGAIDQVAHIPTVEEVILQRVRCSISTWESFEQRYDERRRYVHRLHTTLRLLLGNRAFEQLDEELRANRWANNPDYYNHLLSKEIATRTGLTENQVYYMHRNLYLPAPRQTQEDQTR